MSSTLLDGLAERERIVLIDMGTAPDMLTQARALWSLHAKLDRAYLARRIDEETMGDLSIEALKGHTL